MPEIETRLIRNRDIVLLNRVYGLMQDIQSLEKRREWQRERMQNITSHLSGMPGGGGTPKGLDEAFAVLSDIEERHRLMIREYVRELRRAEDIIAAIQSDHMRTFVRLCYLDSIPGRVIRERLNMTRRGYDNARAAIEQAEDMASVKWKDRYVVEV